jgi:hypothetical protein
MNVSTYLPVIRWFFFDGHKDAFVISSYDKSEYFGTLLFAAVMYSFACRGLSWA